MNESTSVAIDHNTNYPQVVAALAAEHMQVLYFNSQPHSQFLAAFANIHARRYHGKDILNN